MAQTGANSVSLVGRAFQATGTSSTITQTANTTDLARLGDIIDQAHEDGLKVTLTPHIDSVDGTARFQMKPADTARWFADYKTLLVDYAKVAETHGVEMLSLGTELDNLITPANAGYWNDIISAVRAVYHGEVTYQASWSVAKSVTFWDKLDVISLDAYNPVANNTTPTVQSVMDAWTSVSSNTYVAEKLGYMSPIDFYRSLATTYDKPVEFGEIGYRNGDGAGITPGDWQTVLAPDPAEQKVLLQGFFQVMSQETSWFRGANLWEWSDAPGSSPEASYDLNHSAALDLVKAWYGGANTASTGRTVTGTVADDVLTGGSGDDVLLGGAGDDTLRGGAGNDRLSGDEGVSALTGKLVVYATGTGAGGVDALMQVSVNGKVIGTVSVPKTADGSSAAFTFDAPTGKINNVAVSFINDAVIGKEDRNLYLQEVQLNGVTLDAKDATNNRLAGTYRLSTNGTIAFNLANKDYFAAGSSHGNDILDGGAGNDVLTGGGGIDHFVFQPGSGLDVVTDFGQQGDHDVIDISAYLAAGLKPVISDVGSDVEISFSTGDAITLLGVHAANLKASAEGFVYAAAAAQPATGHNAVTTSAASYTLDGSTKDATATGSGDTTLTGNAQDNILNGGAGDNHLYGLTGNDVLNGGAGNDYLDGGSGDDRMTGGAGNDTYVVDSVGDVVVEAAGGGTDTVITSLYTYTLGDNVENLTYTGTHAATLTGNALDNVITGGAGADRLYGGGGNDTLHGGNGADILVGGSGNDILDGGAGDDTMTGGAGNDTYYVDSPRDIVIEAVGGGNDTILTDSNYTLVAGNEIETLRARDAAGTAPLVLTGNEFDNVIVGNAGTNKLYGGAGNDTLDGGAGDDILFGGTGNDTYYVDSANDVIIEAPGEGTDTVYTTVNYKLAGNQAVENLIARDASATTPLNLAGNSLDNIITGNAGDNGLDGGDGNDILDGGAGADYMIGGNGNDTYYVDNAKDYVKELVGGGYDTVYTTVSYALGGGMEVERLAVRDAASTAPINLTGNELANILVGNAGDNILDGGGGNDTLIGGAGNDTYIVDSAGDVIIEAAGGGTDTVLTDVSYKLAGNQEIENLSARNVWATTAITLTGNGLDNVITGNAGDNVIDGGDGNDTIEGGLGKDYMIGGAGNDTYYVDNAGDTIKELVGGGNDTVITTVSYALGAGQEIEKLTVKDIAATTPINLTGNEFANIIIGNAGNNIIDGGAGADTMIGGDGDDIYYVDNIGDRVIETANGGNDTVRTTLSSYKLPDNVENLVYVRGAPANLALDASVKIADTAMVELTGNALANTISGSGGPEIMSGGAGNDTYIVDNAGDIVREAVGGGYDVVQTEVSYALAAGQEVERLVARYADLTRPINLTGNEFANTLIGNAGNNILDGGAGSGIDTMVGGAGNDTYIVHNAADTTVEAVGGGIDTVLSDVSYTLSSSQEVENLSALTPGSKAAINLSGNSLNNVITGNAGDNILFGGDGNDTLIGGGGKDYLIGGNGNDTYYVDSPDDVVKELVGGGNDTVFTDSSFTLGAGMEIERLTARNATSTAAFRLTGNEFNNIITGNAGDNIIDGGKGADIMLGGAGNDTYIVDNAGDVVIEAVGGGIDTVLTSVSYKLAGNQEIENLTAQDPAAKTPLNLTGNGLDNIITGNQGDNILDGGDGNDLLNGRGGKDYMAGGNGNDTYWVDSMDDYVKEAVGGGFDTVLADNSFKLTAGQEIERLFARDATATWTMTLTGNEFANTIRGNAGANIIDGGKGNDILTGNGGNDTFLFTKGGGQDIITDFGVGDTIDISDFLKSRMSATISEVGGNAKISFTNGDSLVLEGVHADGLVATATGYTAAASVGSHNGGSFDAVGYLLSNADLGKAGLGEDGALRHWIEKGIAEGRAGDSLYGHDQASHDAVIGGHTLGQLETAGDRDWFGITLAAGQHVSLALNGTGGAGGLADPFLTLFDSTGKQLAADDNGGGGKNALIDFTATSSGTYYLSTTAADQHATGAYDLVIM